MHAISRHLRDVAAASAECGTRFVDHCHHRPKAVIAPSDRIGDRGDELAMAFDARKIVHDVKASLRVVSCACSNAEASQAQPRLTADDDGPIDASWRSVLA